jgi:hypothetical protein
MKSSFHKHKIRKVVIKYVCMELFPVSNDVCLPSLCPVDLISYFYFLLVIVFGHCILNMLGRHRLTKICNLLMSSCFAFQVKTF